VELTKLKERVEAVESGLAIQHQINGINLEIDKQLLNKITEVGAQCNMEGEHKQ
jgi:hypothetical protein